MAPDLTSAKRVFEDFDPGCGEVPNLTPKKRTSDEFARVNDGDLSTTKMKGVKVEKE